MNAATLTAYLAMDCELVQSATRASVVARCCILNANGELVYDKTVNQSASPLVAQLPLQSQPQISEMRPRLQGAVSPLSSVGSQQQEQFAASSSVASHVMTGSVDFQTLREEVSGLIKNRIIIGFNIAIDFQALNLIHPARLVRDIAFCKTLCPRTYIFS